MLMTQNRFETVIIGGGLHGTAVAAGLVRRGARRDSIVIIDPRPLMSNWTNATESIGQTHMRSPWTHYLDGYGDELKNFALASGFLLRNLNAATPPMWAFNGYCRRMAKKLQLGRLYRQGTVSFFEKEEREVIWFV